MSPALVLERSSGIEFQLWLAQSRLVFHLVLPLRTDEMQIQTLLADTVALVGSDLANMHLLGPRLAHTATMRLLLPIVCNFRQLYLAVSLI